MADTFSTFTPGLTSPAFHAASVTTSDSVDLTNTARALYVGTVGDLVVTTKGGETVTLVSVKGLLPLSISRVWSTGTTAASIVALW